MPYPTQHAARIRDPKDFEEDSFKRKNIAEGIDIIIGHLKGETTMTTQAYRFEKDKFTVSEAKKWLKDHNIEYILFEPASEPNEKDRATYPMFIFDRFDDRLANNIVSNLLYYENFMSDEVVDNIDESNFYKPQKSKIKMWINSPGGYVTDLMSIVDTMNNIKTPIETYCLGIAASCAAVLLANGTKGKRFIGKNSHVLLHQVSFETSGNIQDVEKSVEQSKKFNEQILDLLSKVTGKDKEIIREDIERDLWLNAEEALNYGIVDKILDDNSNEVKSFNLLMEKKNNDIATKEFKNFDVKLEIKSIEEDDNIFTFKAYASVFDEEDLGNDIVCKGAFKNTLLQYKILDKTNERTLLWQHDIKQPIGKTYLKEDEYGLFVEGKLPKDDDFVKGRVIPQMKIGAIKNMSFGYITKDSYIKNGKRFITDIDLFEISLVTIPMQTTSKIISYKSKDIKNLELNDLSKFKNISDLRNYLKNKDYTVSERNNIIYQLKQIFISPCDEEIKNNIPCDEEKESCDEILNSIKENLLLINQSIKE